MASAVASSPRGGEPDADEALLASSGDRGEWAAARQSRARAARATPDHSTFAGRAFMTWLVSLIWRGFRQRGIDREHLPGLRRRYLSSNLYPEFARKLEKHRGFAKSLFLVPEVTRTVVFGSMLSSCQGILGTAGRPLVLALVVDAVENGIELGYAIAYVLLFAAVVFFEGWFGVLGRQLLSEEFGTQFQICASSAVYAKMLRLDTQRAPIDRSTESSLIGNDVVRAYENIRTASNLPMAIAGVVAGIVILLVIIGPPALVGICIMTLIMIGNVCVGKLTHSIEQRNLRAADERLSVMAAVIESIRAVKLFGWEESYKRKLFTIRDRECTHIRNYRLAHVLSIVSGRASPALSSMATLVYFVTSGNNLTIATAYATVSVFQALRLGLIFVPLCFTSTMALDVTIRRLDSYLSLPDRPPPRYLESSVPPVASPSGATDHPAASVSASSHHLAADPRESRDGAVSPSSFRLEQTGKQTCHSSLEQTGEQTSHSRTGRSTDAMASSAPEAVSRQDESVHSSNGVAPGEAAARGVAADSQAGMEEGPEQSAQPLVQIKNCDLGWVTASRVDLHGPQKTGQKGGSNDVDIEVGPADLTPPVLRDVQLTIPPGMIVAVVGAVGSGKSTLLCSICQTILPVREPDAVQTTSSIGYAPQKPFVVCGTIEQNVLLGRAFDQERFDSVLKRSGLEADIKLFPNGVYTEIGERGTTLSGGQQSRLGVARSLYGDPELLVLDDPLSAVDAKVCRQMFNKSIKQQVAGRRTHSVVVSLNQLGLLPRTDRIIFLKNGRISGQGTFDYLLANNLDFSAFVASHRENHDDDRSATSSELSSRPESAMGNGNEKPNAQSAAKAKALAPGVSILSAEKRSTGVISGSIYYRYLSSMGLGFFSLCVFLSLAGYIAMALQDYWLTRWSKELDTGDQSRNGFYAGVYGALSSSFGILILTSSWMLCFGGVRASKSLHNTMLHHLMRAPMSWFESNSSGRILSRFSGDMAKVDMILSLTVDNLIQIACSLLVLLAVICAAVPLMTVVIVVSAVVFCLMIVALDRASREVRRMSNDSMSPLLSNAGEAVRGRDMILAMRCTGFFEARHRLASDEYARANFCAGSIINFGMLASQILSFIVSVTSATLLVVLHHKFPTDLIGISLAYAFLVPYFAYTTVQVTIRMNSFFTSFERLLEYDRLPSEPQSFTTAVADGAWPSEGEIAFENASLRYRDGLPLVLRQVNFTLPAHSSVGIVGRTGAGKSSLIAALFRLVGLADGSIKIDGVDIAALPLDQLRRSLTIIPQDPVLMDGSVRDNLDPFGDYSEEALEHALDLVGLSGRISLTDQVDDSGSNWSGGERQLLSFARATLRDTKILILDEPTSSIDLATDESLQRMVKEEFMQKRRCTVLCIAHRLNTICDFDQVLVMDKGQVCEIGPAPELLANPESEFSSMVAALGAVSQQQLRAKVAARDWSRPAWESMVQHE